jgi:hypothetical protein
VAFAINRSKERKVESSAPRTAFKISKKQTASSQPMPQNFSLSLANSDQEVYSTPNTVSKPKRLLSADSSPDVSMSDPKKIR